MMQYSFQCPFVLCVRSSSLGRQTVNFAAHLDESRDKFTGDYHPPTLRHLTESKILPLSRNKLVI